jgi:DNA repair exonuclease SbcCD ATPase subunit
MESQEIQEIERKKRSLKRYKKNIMRIERLEEKLELLEKRITSVKAPNYSGMPRGGQPVTMADLIADKTELEERIESLKEKQKDIRREIIREIDTLDDYRHTDVLESFFIKCMSLEDIADELGYTPRHVYRLYSEAVKILALEQQ